MKKISIVLLVIVLTFVMAAYSSGGKSESNDTPANMPKVSHGFPIVNSGKPMASIIIPYHASSVVKYAANELQWHIEKATGVKLNIYIENDIIPINLNKIYIGPCNIIRQANIKIEDFTANAFQIKITDKAMFLVGKDGPGEPPLDDTTSQGSLFAVYEWLENRVNVKWLWPGELGTIIPQLISLESGPVSLKTITPTLISSNFRFFPGDWSGFGENVRKRYVEETNIWLRRHRFARPANLSYGHAFTDYWKRFGQTNPEFFAMRTDGKREPYDKRVDLVQLCVSNKKLHKQIIADWLTYRTPNMSWINANENDKREDDQSCNCENCKAWDAKKVTYVHGSNQVISKSDRYAKFYLALQSEAEKYNPRVAVIGMAYADYTDPPLETKLNEKIVIRVVPTFQFPLSLSDAGSFIKLWSGWAQTNARLILRPNYTLEGYCLPYIYARQFGEQYKYASKNGLIATDFDSMTGMWGVNGPTLYMIGCLNKNPNMEVADVLNEYYAGFGQAAEHIRSYFNYWESITPIRDSEFNKKYPGGGWSAMSVSGNKIYTPLHFREASKILDKARILAEGNELCFKRILFLEIWLKHAELAMNTLTAYNKYKDNQSDALLKNALEESKKTLDSYRLTHLAELGLGNLPFLNRLEKWAGWRN